MIHGCFYKLGVSFAGVLIIRALLSGVYFGAPFGNPHILKHTP